jgi:hypothetical protein
MSYNIWDKESVEITSIVLEMCAYPLVTIDLYGRKRLEIFWNKILLIDIDYLVDNLSRVLTLKRMFLIIASIYCICFCSRIYYILSDPSVVQTMLVVIIEILFSSFLIVIVVVVILGFIFFTLFTLLLLGTSTLNYISRIFPIEGIMLFVGTLLFATAKTLALIAGSMHELSAK